MNESLFVLSLLLCLSLVLLFYKLFGKTGLLIWIALSTVICNIQTTKIVNILFFETNLGSILYGSTFLATDILNEYYGEKVAKKTIIIGFISMIIMSILMLITLLYIPSSSDFANDSLKVIFDFNFRITIGSLVGFVISQLIDTLLYNKIKKKYKPLWIRNNLSTIVSQFFDSLIFVTITFFGILKIKNILMMLLSTLLIKVFVAILDTPFIYLSKKIKCNEL